MTEDAWETFTCEECGRSIARLRGLGIDCGLMCAACLMLPGWFQDPQLVKMLDPFPQKPKATPDG